MSTIQKHFPRLFIAITCIIFLTADFLFAGPPFVTDDPEPVKYRHWEVYLASQFQTGSGNSNGNAPSVEFNYGAFPEVQLHIIVPLEYASSQGNPIQYGIGDTELGIKYRFVKETNSTPQIGIFPRYEIPLGNYYNGLGAGYATAFLPVWVQKSWGPWTTYGGGGIWYNNIGNGNRNYIQTGWELQRDLNKYMTIGAEFFNYSARSQNYGNETGINLGTIINISEEYHLLFSAGSDIAGPNSLFTYIAFQWTAGPKLSKTRTD